MKKSYWTAILGVGISLSLSIPNPSLEAILASVKASGMGGVGVAYPQDAMAGAFNPAGMSEVCDRVDIAVMPVHTKAEVDVSNSPIPGMNGHVENKLRNFYNPTFGINKQLDFCGCENMTFGLMGYNFGHLDATYPHTFPLFGDTNLQLDITQEMIAPVWTIKLNECHSFGIALDIAVQSIRVRGLQNFANPRFSSSPNHVTNKGRDYSYGVGVTLGWLGHVTDWLTLGLSYQPKIGMSRFDKYSGLLAQHGKLDIPQQVNFGLAVNVLPCMNVAFDVNWQDWNHVRSIHHKITPNLFTSKLGNKDGAGFGWKDQVFYRVGVDYRLTDCLTVRAGYRHNTPAFNGSQNAVNIATVETAGDFVTVGASYYFGCWGEFSGFYAHGFRRKVDGPNAIDRNLGGGNVDLTQTIDAWGLAWGYEF